MPRRPQAEPPAPGDAALATVLRPHFVSQHTAPAVLGFKNARAFIEWAARSGCRVIARGKDRLVAFDEAVAALASTGGAQAAPAAPEPSAERQPDTEREVLEQLGLRPRPALRVVGGR